MSHVINKSMKLINPICGLERRTLQFFHKASFYQWKIDTEISE